MSENFIPYGRQEITSEDIFEINNVLKGDFLTQGPKVKQFEDKFSEYIGCKYAVAVSNGTAALHLATIAIGLKKNEKVITTPITFVASANCVRFLEGEIVFSDIDSDTYLIDIEKIEVLLKKSPKGTYKGIIPVNFAGRVVDLEKLSSIAKKYDLWIIEDACHSPGGFFIDSFGVKQNSGNGVFADLSIFSFHPVKHIATGEGGMITTNNKKLYEKLIELRTHGIIRNPSNFINNIDLATGQLGEKEYPGWYMEMQNLGYNYRLTDFQSALGISQLNRAEIGLKRRIEIARKYYNSLYNKPFIIRQSGLPIGHAYHLYVIEVNNRIGLYNYLKEHNIHTQVHYIPCHLMPYYRELGWEYGDFLNAESYYRNCLSLPIYPSLTDEDLNFVIKKINDFYE